MGTSNRFLLREGLKTASPETWMRFRAEPFSGELDSVRAIAGYSGIITVLQSKARESFNRQDSHDHHVRKMSRPRMEATASGVHPMRDYGTSHRSGAASKVLDAGVKRPHSRVNAGMKIPALALRAAQVGMAV
jgi:hypothetical protein